MVSSWLDLKDGFSSVPSVICRVQTWSSNRQKDPNTGLHSGLPRIHPNWVADTPAPWYKTLATCEALRSTEVIWSVLRRNVIKPPGFSQIFAICFHRLTVWLDLHSVPVQISPICRQVTPVLLKPVRKSHQKFLSRTLGFRPRWDRWSDRSLHINHEGFGALL